VLALVWALTWAISTWRYRAGLANAEHAIASGRYAEARAWLAAQSARRPGSAEVEYALGYCERALGHPDAAVAAWERVPSDSSWPRRAAFDHVRILVADLGRFADAEELLPPLLTGTNPSAVDARHMLFQLEFWEGRSDEMRRLIEVAWRTLPDRAAEL